MLRIIGVTALVSILGGFVGALAAAAVLAVVLSLPNVSIIYPFGGLLDFFLVPMVLGFVVGGFLSPVMTWLFMRRVPLWRASLETSFASMIGLVLGIVIQLGPIATIGTTLGFAVLAALRLKRVFRTPAAEPEIV